MSGPIRGFQPSELLGGDDQPSAAELADAFAAARSLEAHARRDEVRPMADFEDRVMAAIAREPAPRVVFGARSAERAGVAGILAGFAGTIRDAWGVAVAGGRPLAVRAQALGFLLLVGVLATSLTGVTAAGVGALLNANQGPAPTAPAPAVSPSETGPSPTVAPSPSPTPSPTASPSPSATASPSPTSSPSATQTTEPTGTDDPSETPDATGTSEPDETPRATDDDNSGPGGGGSGSDD